MSRTIRSLLRPAGHSVRELETAATACPPSPRRVGELRASERLDSGHGLPVVRESPIMRNVAAASGHRATRIVAAFGVAAGLLVACSVADAQVTRAGGLIRHDRGQSVSPVYEGWYQRPDGTIVASFGYFNRNHAEEVSIPVGPNNRVAPGLEDQGQPTYFFPRRQIGLFTVTLPADGDAEVTWTLTSRGETLEIPVNLDSEYLIEPFRAAAGPSPGNAPPLVRFDPADEGFSGPAGGVAERTATAGVPLALEVWVSDDGLGSGRDEPELTVTWRKFRGPGAVGFEEDSPDVETADGPADGVRRAGTTATLSEPGDYVLHVVAADGSRQSNQCCWTNGYVRVRVDAADAARD